MFWLGLGIGIVVGIGGFLLILKLLVRAEDAERDEQIRLAEREQTIRLTERARSANLPVGPVAVDRTDVGTAARDRVTVTGRDGRVTVSYKLPETLQMRSGGRE